MRWKECDMAARLIFFFFLAAAAAELELPFPVELSETAVQEKYVS